MALRFYRAAVATLVPALSPLLRRRFVRKGGDPARWPERLGTDVSDRPDGALIWVHAVSVGEMMAALPLVDALLSARTDARVLLTTTTASSAGLAAMRLPERALHRFSPLDSPAAVSRFLDRWRPERAIFLESEIWPVQIADLSARRIPLALVSARLTERSAARWARIAPGTARAVFSRIALVLAQDEATARRARDLGAPRVEVTGSLKSAAPRLPVDAGERAAMAAAIGARPVWVAASTHDGEEEVVLDAHRQVLTGHPQALLILAPRHIERRDDIPRAGLVTRMRSAGALPDAGTQVYLADSYGEMGLWFSLARIVFLGGSLRDGIGGHNPLEPAAFGATVLTGPYTANSEAAFAGLIAAGAAHRVADAAALAGKVSDLLPGDAPPPGPAAGDPDLGRRVARLCLEL
ncbi:3-deoxy-D-manno-octulosonic acid transferase [Palleronia rufa]|uniref:3-deoxy-D-manno-octulosonic acid transferase n=1 Tax=Palleronia rufa TaxID=1530186 RepID=UPI00068FA47A|nr:3-deoxy-D-manno-octulosonic acid transferase [Palleronia rufa]